MGELLGIRDEKLNFGLTGTYFQTYWEIRKLLVNERITTNSREDEIKKIKIHNIEKIQEDKKAITEASKKGLAASHRVVFNDLLLLDQEIKVLSRTARENRIIAKIKPALKKKIDMHNKAIVGVLDEVEKELKDEQVAIFDLEKTAEGGTGIALAFKGMTRKQMKILTRLVMKWNCKRMVKDQKKVEEAQHQVTKMRLKIKSGKAKKSDMDQFEKTQNNLIKVATDEARKSYKLLINDYLTLNIIIGVLRDEIKSDDELVAAHEIPTVMGQLDKKTKKEILAEVHTKLESERRVIMQVFHDARLAKGVAAG